MSLKARMVNHFRFFRCKISQPNHMVDWVNCIQTRGTPKCSTDEAFIETATFLMSLKSQQEQRLVRWDAAREEIA